MVKMRNTKDESGTKRVKDLGPRGAGRVKGGLDGRDKLGNTKIQTLTSDYNEPSTTTQK